MNDESDFSEGTRMVGVCMYTQKQQFSLEDLSKFQIALLYVCVYICIYMYFQAFRHANHLGNLGIHKNG